MTFCEDCKNMVEIKVDTFPTYVMFVCPNCGHVFDVEYKEDFENQLVDNFPVH
jgi:DNA-directed RNA polymerase subunit M/transcription elongation factor TFIIS